MNPKQNTILSGRSCSNEDHDDYDEMALMNTEME